MEISHTNAVIITTKRHYKYGDGDERVSVTELYIDKTDGHIELSVGDNSVSDVSADNILFDNMLCLDILHIADLMKIFTAANKEVEDIITQHFGTINYEEGM